MPRHPGLDQLQLTDAQKAKLKELRKEYAPKFQETLKKFSGVLTEDQKKVRKEAFKAAATTGKDRKEAREVAEKALKLSPEQKAKLDDARKAMESLKKEVHEKALAVFTAEQKEKIEKFKAEQPRRHGPMGPGAMGPRPDGGKCPLADGKPCPMAAKKSLPAPDGKGPGPKGPPGAEKMGRPDFGAQGPMGPGGPGSMGPGGHGRMGRPGPGFGGSLKALNLTDDQKSKIEALLTPEQRETFKKSLEAKGAPEARK